MNPTEGQVTVTDENGDRITDSVEQKRRIGYLSGNTKLYHRLSVREMLMMLAEIYGIEKGEAEKRVEEISNVLDMSAFLDNRIERLSTGQTQRASIARCLIHEPDIYIFDEPTLGLDILSADAIVNFMKTRKEVGKTVLYSTHYLEEAQFLCDRVLMIDHGNIVCEGSPKEIMQRTDTENLREAFHVIMAGGQRTADGDSKNTRDAKYTGLTKSRPENGALPADEVKMTDTEKKNKKAEKGGEEQP